MENKKVTQENYSKECVRKRKRREREQKMTNTQVKGLVRDSKKRVGRDFGRRLNER